MPRKKNTDIRNEILKAALTLFGQYGFKKTTVDEIAERAGIGKGTVYLHFSNKEDILCANVKENAERMLKKLQIALSKMGAPEEKLLRVLQWRTERVFEFHEKYLHAVELMPVIKKEIRRRMGDGPIKTYITILQGVLDEGNAKGVFKVDDTGALAKHINFMSFAFMPPFRMYETKKEIQKQAKQYFIHLLKSITSK